MECSGATGAVSTHNLMRSEEGPHQMQPEASPTVVSGMRVFFSQQQGPFHVVVLGTPQPPGCAWFCIALGWRGGGSGHLSDVPVSRLSPYLTRLDSSKTNVSPMRPAIRTHS